MGDIGTPMTSGTVPAVGTSGTGYATTINAFLTEAKGRLEAKVPFSSLLVGTLDMANNAIQNVSNLLLYPGSGVPSTPTGSIQRYNNDLYWVSASGAVQITSGASLNSAGIGGITGDYGGANPAQFRFVDVDQTYYAYDDFGGAAWAYIQGRGMQITAGLTSLVRVRIQWAGSSSYDITLPASLPASQSLMQMDASGNVTASNTLATNQSVTVAGTGTFKHGDQTICHAPIAMAVPVGAYAAEVTDGASDFAQFNLTTGGGKAYIPLVGLRTGDRLKSVAVAGNATVSPTLEIVEFVSATGLTRSYTTSGSFNGLGGITLTLVTPITMAADGIHRYICVKILSGASEVDVYSIFFTYDRP